MTRKWKTKDQVLHEFKRHPEARCNDMLLIAYIMKDFYDITDLFTASNYFTKNIYESVRRSRQKLQETNPMLRPDESCLELRAKREKKIREAMKGV